MRGRGAQGEDGIMAMKLKSKIALAGVVAAFFCGSAQAETYALSAVSFRDFTGAVEIKTTSGDEIDIAIRQGRTYTPVTLTEDDGVLVVTGERWKEDDADDCCNRRITRHVSPREGRTLSIGEAVDEDLFSNYPTIEVLMPYKGDVEFIDARIKLAMERLAGALHGCLMKPGRRTVKRRKVVITERDLGDG